MKKIVALLVLVALVMTVCASAFAEMITGGWEMFPAESAILTEENQLEPMMTDRAADAFRKATEARDDKEYTPVALLATQVVAGTNYCILCQVTEPDSTPKWELVYIYADPEGNATIMNEYEIYIERHAQPKEDAE